MNLTLQFKNFYKNYPFLQFNDLIDYFLLFGGVEEFIELNLESKSIHTILDDLLNSNIIEQLPFFLLDEPFKTILVLLAKGDAKIDTAFKKSKISSSFKEDILKELIENSIVYIEHSREKPLKEYAKQKIKKEFRHYSIQNKLRFTKPFYHFFFRFIAPNIDMYYNFKKETILESIEKSSNKVISFYFEELSRELIKKEFANVTECYSYWDKYSEFDIYCKIADSYLIGECKYTNKPITKYELQKLESKIEKSKLENNYLALFSKSGFSKELEKIKRDNLYLYTLDSFKKLLLLK